MNRLRQGLHSAAGIAALFTAAVAFGAASASAQDIVSDQPIGDRVHVLTIRTDAFAAPTKVDVFLPTGYDADPARRWPVTYVTAGTMNNYDSFRKVLKGVDLTAKYPSLIVSPDGNSGYWSDWYNGGKLGPPAYETFVIKQLIPLIDGRYRTKDDRAHRLVTGVSMGGYGAAMFAARHPDLFAAVSSISGAVDSNLPYLAAAVSASSTFDGGDVDAIYGPRATQEVRWHGHNPTDLAENLRDVDVQVRTANGIPAPEIGENPLSADGVSCVIEQGVYRGSMSFHDRLDGDRQAASLQGLRQRLPHLRELHAPDDRHAGPLREAARRPAARPADVRLQGDRAAVRHLGLARRERSRAGAGVHARQGDPGPS